MPRWVTVWPRRRVRLVPGEPVPVPGAHTGTGVPEVPEIPADGTRFSLTACPGGTFPRNQGRGAMHSGKEGGRGWKEATPVPASQPSRLASQHGVQCPVPEPAPKRSALSCFCAQGLFNTVSLPPCPSALPVDFIISKTCHRAQNLSAAVAASNPRSLFANTLRKSSSTPVIRFVFLFSFRQPV